METCISLVFLHNLYHFISFERIFVMWYNNFLCWIKYFIIIQLILLFLWISQEYIIVLPKIIILWDTICANKQLPIPNVHIFISTHPPGTFGTVEHVLLVGVAGGVPHYADFYKDVRLGDVILSDLNADGRMYLYCDKLTKTGTS